MNLWIEGASGVGKTQLHTALVAAGMLDPAIFVFHKSERGYTLGCVAALPRNVLPPDCKVTLRPTPEALHVVVQRGANVLARLYVEPTDAAWPSRVAAIVHLLLPELTAPRNRNA